MSLSATLSDFVADIAQDLRIALRRMQRAPALAIAIVLTLGLGLGAAAAIFTASESALIEPLPYAEPERLVHLWELRAGSEERSPTSYPTLLDWRSRASSFAALEGYDPGNLTVGVGDEARMLRGAWITPGFFRLLGVRTSTGRDFLPGADGASEAGAAIVSAGFARSIGDRALNQTIRVNGAPYLIVGVLPNAFHFALLQNADVFVPLAVDERRRQDRTDRSVHVVGRLGGNATLAGAAAELSAVTTALATEHPDALTGRTAALAQLRDVLIAPVKPILASLLIAVAMLLVTMGANLALLMLTRYIERSPELAMRAALGASRARVLRQLVVESLAPGIAGAALAIAIGQMSTSAWLAAIPERIRIDLPYLAGAGLDAKVIAVIAGLAMLLAVGFGLGPALLVTNDRRWGWVRSGEVRTTRSRGERQVRQGLVAAQTALTVVLLVAAGLLVASFSNLLHRDIGFRDPETLVSVAAPLSGEKYRSDAAQRQFFEALTARAAALPGVRQASGISDAPGGGGGVTTFEPIDRPRASSQQPRAMLRIVAAGYFSTMGIPLVSGRDVAPSDGEDSPRVAVVSTSFARRLREDGEVVGRRIHLAATRGVGWEVVGVVGDVQATALDTESPPVVYVSHLQLAENRMKLVLRMSAGAPPVASQVRAIVKTMDAGIPVYGFTTLQQQMTDSRALFTRRFPMILIGVFAAAALALTLVALYAICMHEVVTRRREFGIRLALGSSPSAIRRLILSDAVRVGATGIAVGVAVALLVSRSMQTVLYGIPATDWRVHGSVALGVLAAAILSTLAPAARASAVNPSLVMRGE